MEQRENLSDIRKNIAVQRKEHNIEKQTCLTMMKNYKKSRKYVDNISIQFSCSMVSDSL